MSQPASLTWFASHEFRLGWRDWVSLMTAGGRTRARNAVIALVLVAAFMHLFAYWTVARYANANLASDTAALVGIMGTLVLSWALLLSQAMESVTRAFYSRSDLDLILTSPASARKVFAVRMGRIAAAAVAVAVLLAAPFINVLAVLGGLRWLGAYGVVAAMGVVATAAALALTIALFRNHRGQAYAFDRANRGGRNRRGLRYRLADCGDLFRWQPVPLHSIAIRMDAEARTRYRQRFLVAGAGDAWRRRCTGRRGGLRCGDLRPVNCTILAPLRRACRCGRRCLSRYRSATPLVASFSPSFCQSRASPKRMDVAAARRVAGLADAHANSLFAAARTSSMDHVW